MKSVNPFLLRVLGIRRGPPANRLGLLYLCLERAASVVVLALIGLHAFPQMLFAHSLESGGVTIHSPSALPPQTQEVIRQTEALVRASELAVPGRSEHAFVSSERWRVWLFKPFSRSFAFSVPITDNIFVADADVALNRSRGSESVAGPRTLSSVLAHEITHGLVRSRLGAVRAARLPAWLNEGYCDYVARESSFAEEEGRRLLRQGETHPSNSFRYFVYREMVRHLIEDRGMRFDDMVAIADDGDAVRAEMVAALRARYRD